MHILSIQVWNKRYSSTKHSIICMHLWPVTEILKIITRSCVSSGVCQFTIIKSTLLTITTNRMWYRYYFMRFRIVFGIEIWFLTIQQSTMPNKQVEFIQLLVDTACRKTYELYRRCGNATILITLNNDDSQKYTLLLLMWIIFTY